MKRLYSSLIWGLSLVLLLPACQADVDMDHIDSSMLVRTGLDLPLGSMDVTLGDLLNDSASGSIVVDEKGNYTFSSSADLTRTLPAVDIRQYFTEGSGSINLYDLLADKFPEIIGMSLPLPAGTAFALDYHMPLRLSGINAPDSRERLDSADVRDCQFLSKLTLDNISLTWDEIDTISIKLSDDFHCAQHEILFFVSGFDFGQTFPMDLGAFVLSLLKDNTLPAGWNNVKDSTSFDVHVAFKTKQVHTINTSAAVGYSYTVGDFGYNAAYGYFGSSVQMSDHSVMAINDLWRGWDDLSDFFLPLREPRFGMYFTHPIAAPLYVDLQHLYTTNTSHERRDASFNGSAALLTRFPSQIAMTDSLTKRVTDSLKLDYTPANGRIDTLFSIHPDSIAYDLTMGVDNQTSRDAQFRVTTDSIVDIRFNVSAPFYMNPNAHVSYSQDLPIALSALSIDSLLAGAQGIKNASVDTLNLYLNISNTIPFNIYMDYKFFDANGLEIDLGQVRDTIPEPEKDATGEILKPSTHKVVAAMGPEQLEKLVKTEMIKLTFTMGKNTKPARMNTSSNMMVNLGLGIHMTATVNMANNNVQ